jgi:flavin-dependent dehydrogenase
MKSVDIIVVGGGPAGASCARVLTAAGKDCLILDKAAFPRPKLCAGWLTPEVFDLLGIRPEEYPGSLTVFDRLRIHLRGLAFWRKNRQYAIRRIEFDHWLLEQSQTPVQQHRVRHIREENGSFILDETYRCRILVGAGGSHCPVYKALFQRKRPRPAESVIVTLETEFKASPAESDCHLYFFQNGLPGYAWYVPKTGNILNLGIGGMNPSLLKRNENIRDHWSRFIDRLSRKHWLSNGIPHPSAYVYHLRTEVAPYPVQWGQAYLAGDAVGLATADMGEGIAPAIASGQRTARSILTGTPNRFDDIPRFSSLWPEPLIRLADRIKF